MRGNTRTARWIMTAVASTLAAASLTACGGGPATETASGGEFQFGDQPVRILVGHGAGGSTDAIVRAVQRPLQDALGVPVVVENITGGGGMVAAQQANSAEPDGHVLHALPLPAYSLYEQYGENAPNFRDFIPLYRLSGGDANGLAVPADSEFQTVEDLVKAAEEQDLVQASTSGISNSTVAEALFLDKTGAGFTKLPYESGSEAIQAVISGTADVTFASMAALGPAAADGTIRILTYFAEEELEEFSDVQLFSDLYEGAGYSTQLGLTAPPGTPEDAVEHLREALGEATESQAFLDAMEGQSTPAPLPGEEWADVIDEIYTQGEELSDAINAVLEQRNN